MAASYNGRVVDKRSNLVESHSLMTAAPVLSFPVAVTVSIAVVTRRAFWVVVAVTLTAPLAVLAVTAARSMTSAALDSVSVAVAVS